MNPAVMILPCDKCPDDAKTSTISDAGIFGQYLCGNFLGVMGSAEFANDGILLHGGPDSAIKLSQVTDGASHTIIMGERGISNELYGWPYCGAGAKTVSTPATATISCPRRMASLLEMTTGRMTFTSGATIPTCRTSSGPTAPRSP